MIWKSKFVSFAKPGEEEKFAPFSIIDLSYVPNISSVWQSCTSCNGPRCFIRNVLKNCEL